jgi:ornithine cyclodeaminase
VPAYDIHQHFWPEPFVDVLRGRSRPPRIADGRLELEVEGASPFDPGAHTVEGADIVVEAARLPRPEPLLLTEWIKKTALVMPYGTMSMVELSLTDIMDKIVMDDWGQARAGEFGALRAHVNSGRLSEETLHAELGEIVAGLKPGRESDDETILFWHRGLATSDVAVAHAMVERARERGIGTTLPYR